MRFNLDAVSPSINVATTLIYGVQVAMELFTVGEYKDRELNRQGIEHLGNARASLLAFTKLFD